MICPAEELSVTVIVQAIRLRPAAHAPLPIEPFRTPSPQES